MQHDQSDFTVQQNLGQGWQEFQDWLCPCPDLSGECEGNGLKLCLRPFLGDFHPVYL